MLETTPKSGPTWVRGATAATPGPSWWRTARRPGKPAPAWLARATRHAANGSGGRAEAQAATGGLSTLVHRNLRSQRKIPRTEPMFSFFIFFLCDYRLLRLLFARVSARHRLVSPQGRFFIAGGCHDNVKSDWATSIRDSDGLFSFDCASVSPRIPPSEECIGDLRVLPLPRDPVSRCFKVF